MGRDKEKEHLTLLVLGAKLQGTEVIYLAKQAGYHVIAIDRNPEALGADLADEYIQADLLKDEKVILYFQKADAVLPVIEDIEVLEKVKEYCETTKTKLLFDIEAYKISSSKRLSNNLFEELQLPVPSKYPVCDYPVVLKPDNLSGSSNVKKAYSQEEVEAYKKEYGEENVVIQEFLEGASYSLEVIGDGKNFYFPQITEVIVDDTYDCKRIAAPAMVSDSIKEQMMAIGQKLAERLKIKGIFDIEVINHKGKLKLLEIDARFPSQTPISVYHSTGINMVSLMVEQAFGKSKPINKPKQERNCLYQQIVVMGQQVEVLGEHVMSTCSHIKQIEDFYGADEVLTDYDEGKDIWKAIVIITRDTEEEAYEAFETFTRRIETIQKEKVG